MATHERSPIGSVVERTTPRTPFVPSSRFTGTTRTGFPTAQHRSKSAFARARDEANLKGNDAGSRRPGVSSVVSKQPQTRLSVTSETPIVDPKPIPTSTDALLRQIHEENAHKIAHMSEGEIKQEKHAILEQLGEGTGQLLRRVQEARRRKEAKEREAQAQPELEEQAAQETKCKVETKNDDDTRQATGHDHDRKHVALVASPTPRRVSDELATKPGVLRVKSLENIGRTGKLNFDRW